MSRAQASSQFDQETALVPIAGAPNSWSTQVTSAWNIGDNPNGGYLVSSVLRGMQELVPDHPDPISITTHFLRPGSGDAPGVVEAELLRPGRTISTARGTLTQHGKTRISSVASLGDLDATANQRAEVFDMASPAPELAPPEDCMLRSGLEQGVDLPILDRLEVRIPEQYAVAGASKDAEIMGWIRYSDERLVDTSSLPLFADAFPPAVFSKFGFVGWVPTIELTVHVRRKPAPGWVCGSFRCSDLSGSRFIEDGTLWDSTGAVIAQSRQVGMLLT